MGVSNKRFKVLTHVLPRGRKKGGVLLLVLIIVGGFTMCSFFAVVIFFTIFSGFVTTTTHQMESEQLEVNQEFPTIGRKYLSIY